MFLSICIGVGNVTIVDNATVTKEDIRNNFFLGVESTGQSKAKSAAELLQELNEDAVVNYVEKVDFLSLVIQLLKGSFSTIGSNSIN